MNCKKLISLLIGVLLTMSIAPTFGATQCSSMENNWTDSSGFPWGVSGTKGIIVDEVLTGLMAVTTCSYYQLNGTLNNGKFTITATPSTLGTPPLNCATSVTYTGSIKKPGCNTATGTWQNNQGRSGSFSMSSQCVLPSGETTPQSLGFGLYDYQTAATFEQKLLPSDYNFGGRTVSESFPNEGTDTCWWSGSSLSKQTRGKVWPPAVLGSTIPTDYLDTVGMDEVRVKYFRDNNRAPCGYNLPQEVSIDCSSGPSAFKTSILWLGVEATTVSSGRNGVMTSRPWDSGPPTLTNSTRTNVIRNVINFFNGG